MVTTNTTNHDHESELSLCNNALWSQLHNSHAMPTSTWPFKEAEKLQARTFSNNICIFAAGFSPSGAPHIGTLGEIMKVTLVQKAFDALQKSCDNPIKSKLILFSDDMDGLRKVPDNVPKEQMLQYLHFPLTSIPDPYGCCTSYAKHHNNFLQAMLKTYGLECEFCSSTEMYRDGKMNNMLLEVLAKYDRIVSCVSKFVGPERAKYYSPILPKHPKTGKIYQYRVIKVNLNKGTIVFLDENNHEWEIPVINGNCKLQWKVDWSGRWKRFDVGYETHGKDLIGSKEVAEKLSEIFECEPPITMSYELYSDEDNKKISKSKGNGITLSDWERYGTKEGLWQYMFTAPYSAKKLSYSAIIQSHDEYVRAVENNGNIIWFANQNPTLNTTCRISYNMILNLIYMCDTLDADIIFSLLQRYPAIDTSQPMYIRQLIAKSIDFCTNVKTKEQKQEVFSNEEIMAITKFTNYLQQQEQDIKETPIALAQLEDRIQHSVFEIGKQIYQTEYKKFFPIIYRALVKNIHGPRIGSLIGIYGLTQTINKLQKIIAQYH